MRVFAEGAGLTGLDLCIVLFSYSNLDVCRRDGSFPYCWAGFLLKLVGVFAEE